VLGSTPPKSKITALVLGWAEDSMVRSDSRGLILQFIDGLRGDLHVTFEEGVVLYDLLKPHVTTFAMCDPRKNASMREGNQSGKIDARRLSKISNVAII
jgi:hypothetical protein